MSGLTAGIVSIASLFVIAAIFSTFLKNPQGANTLIGDTGTAFTNALVAAQGNATSLQSYPGGY